MRKLILAFCAICMLSMSACGEPAPAGTSGTSGTTACPTSVSTQPALVYDLAYDMEKYDHFGHIFDEKTPQQWENLGRYTILLNGFDTPVIVTMEGMTVLSVSAYGQTAQTDISTYQEETPANIQGTAGAIVVTESLDYESSTWILTADGVHEFCPQGSISTQIFVETDGALRYRTYWGEYDTSFEQWDYAPLDLCTSRDHFLYEFGTATIESGQVIFSAEQTVTVSDLYDLDDMFAAAKADGLYEEFDSVDQLLAFNAQK